MVAPHAEREVSAAPPVVEGLHGRIEALRALIDPVARPRSRTERRALKARFKAIRAAMADVLAYRDAHADVFGALEGHLKKTRKAVLRLVRSGRAVKKPRAKALTTLATLAQDVV